MPQTIRRSRYLFFYLDNRPIADSSRFKGTDEFSKIICLSALNGEMYLLSQNEFLTLQKISSQNSVPLEGLSEEVRKNVTSLVDKGLVYYAEDDEISGESKYTKDREKTINLTAWHPISLLHHVMSSYEGRTWKKVPNPDDVYDSVKRLAHEPELDVDDSAGFYNELSTHAFKEYETAERTKMSIPHLDGEFVETLKNRKTTRVMDPSTPLSISDFSSILYYVWGANGYTRLAGLGHLAIRRTSPSGGCLHPIEVYPLVINVEGIKPGIYHYNVKEHSVELLRELDKDMARSMADKFSCQQTYPRWASVIFISTVRFTRVHLKYKYHRKSYAALHLELGHFSQTLYLSCSYLGLGAFVTAYINNKDVDKLLGIDGITEGSIMINGCGHPMRTEPTLDLIAKEFIPGKTKIGSES